MGNATLVKLRKVIATISLTTLVASLLVVPQAVSAGNLDGVPDYSRDAFEALADLNQDDLRPGDETNKCEYSKILALAFGLEQEVVDFDFTDVPSWATGYVGAMVSNNIASGRSETEFGCNGPMARAEQVKMVVSALGLEPCELEDASEFAGVEWAEGYFCAAMEAGIITGDADTGNVRPTDAAVRAESFTMAYRAVEGDVPEVVVPDPETPEVVVPGDLELTVAPGTASEKSVPKNGFEVPYTTVRFSAEGSPSDVTVTSVAVTRRGLGSSSDFSKVKLYRANGEQLGSEKNVASSSNQAVFNLTSDPLVVPAGGYVDVEVRGDMAGGSIEGSENYLEISSAADVTADGEVGGSFPVAGETMTLANVSVGAITITLTDVTGDLEVGDTDEVLSREQYAASSAEDVEIRKLRYEQTGSADSDDFSNLVLYKGADAIAENPVWEGDYAVFTFEEPLVIDDGDDVNLVLRGDVVGGINDTVGFKIKDSQDVEAYGVTLGFRASVTEDSTSPTNRSIVGGDLNLSLAADNPPAEDVGIGDENREFMRFNAVTAGDAIRIEDFDLTLTPATASASELTDIKISVVNEDGTLGEVVAGPVDGSETTASTAETIDFTDDWEIPAQSTNTYAVTADVDTGVSASDTFVFAIDVSGISAEYVSTSDTLTNATDITPTSDITGSTMTVQAPTLTASLASTPASKTVVINSNDVDIAGYNLRANTVSDILVTSMTLQQYTSGTDDIQDVSNIRLYQVMSDGSRVLVSSGGKSLTSNATPTAVFSSVNIDIEAGETVSLMAVADIPSSATATQSFGLGIPASGITAQDEKGRTSTVTVSGLALNDTPDSEVTIASSGTLTAALDGDSPVSAVLSTSTSMNPVTTVRFNAEDDSFTVTKFQVKADDSSDADELVSFTAKYMNKAGEEVTTSESVNSDGTANFAGETLFVTAGQDTLMYIYANTATETGGADSHTTLGVDFDFDTNFEAFGKGANNRLTSVGAADIAGNHHKVYAAELLVAINSASPTSSTVTEGAGQPVLKFDVTAVGEHTPSVMAVGLTVSGTADLDRTNATGSATLEDESGDVEATEAYKQDVSAVDGTTTTFDGDDVDGIPVGANVIIFDGSDGFLTEVRKVTGINGTTDIATLTAALSFATDTDASDTLTYAPLQPGTGKLHFGGASHLTADYADTDTTLTVASTDGFAIGDTVTARGATSAGVVIACTGTITVLATDGVTVTTSAADCTDNTDIDFDNVSTTNAAVAYVNLIDEEISGTETFTVKGDLTGATPSSGTKTVQLRINAGTDIDWNDDWPDVGDDVDDADENTAFLIEESNLNKEEDGYENFPLNGNALSFEG